LFNAISFFVSVRDQLVRIPPVQFTQIYYECYNNAQSALLAAVGIASGNVQIFLPFLAFGVLPLFYIVLVIIGQVPPKDEYNNKEVCSLSFASAFNLLLVLTYQSYVYLIER
jgi:hypothetical protein